MSIDPAKLSGMTEEELIAFFGNALSTIARELIQSSIEEVTGEEYSLGGIMTFAQLGITGQQKELILEVASQKAETQNLALVSNGPKPSTDLIQTISDATNYILHIY